jgi:hypothetical protein
MFMKKITKIDRMRIANSIIDKFNIDEFFSFILLQTTLSKKKNVISDFLYEIFEDVSKLLFKKKNIENLNKDEILEEIKQTLSEVSQFLIVKINNHKSQVKKDFNKFSNSEKQNNLISQIYFEKLFSKHLKNKSADIFLNNNFNEDEYEKISDEVYDDEIKIKELVLFKKNIRPVQGDTIYEVAGLKELYKDYTENSHNNIDYYRHNPLGIKHEKIKVNINELFKKYKTNKDFFLGFEKNYILEKTFDFYNIDENFIETEEIVETNLINKNLSEKLYEEPNSEIDFKQTYFKYIIAFILWNFLHNSMIYLFDKNFKLPEDILLLSFIIILKGIWISASFVIIYNFFYNLNIRKVLVWAWIIQGISYMSKIGYIIKDYQTIGIYENYYLEIIFLFIGSFILGMSMTRSYYKDNKSRWY